MVRVVFEQLEKFEKWIDDHVKPKKYECYVTKYNEVIMVPLVSTRPLKYGYMQLLSSASVEKLEKKLTEMGVEIYGAGSVEWDTDKPVGVGVTPIPK